MPKKILTSFLTIMLMLVTSTANATNKAQECDHLKSQVKACEEVLSLADKLIEEQQRTILRQEDLINDLDKQLANYKELESLRKSRDSKWYRNPTNMLLLGLASGIVMGVYVGGK